MLKTASPSQSLPLLESWSQTLTLMLASTSIAPLQQSPEKPVGLLLELWVPVVRHAVPSGW